MADTSTPAESGTGTIAEAANAFEAILAREDGEPDAEKRDDEAPSDQEADDVDAAADETAAEATAEDDAAEGEDAEEGEDADDDGEQPKTITLKLEGKAVEVPIDEVEKGYLRTADYTRKTQQLAEERRALYGEVQAVREERQQYAATLQALQQQLAAAAEQEPDWDRLWAQDPIEWVRQRELSNERKQKAAAAQFEMERVRAVQAQEQQREMAQALQGQRQRLTELVPEARDASKWEATRQSIRSYAKAMGYTDEEIGAAYDARAIAIMRDGMKYRELMSKKPPQPQPARSAPAVPQRSVKPARRVTEVARANMRLAKTGKIQDAADVFMKIPGLI